MGLGFPIISIIETYLMQKTKRTILTPVVKIIILLFAGMLTAFFLSCSNDPAAHLIYLENSRIKLGFDRKTGLLRVFDDLDHFYEFLSEDIVSGSPWQIYLFSGSGTKVVDISKASRFHIEKVDSRNLVFIWNEFADIKNKNFQVEVKVILEKDEPSSAWQISLTGCEGLNLSSVVFPRISGLKNPGKEFLAVPSWMGELIEDPRIQLSKLSGREKKYEWTYPGPLSMQCMALYSPQKCGFYAACHDSLAYRKSFGFLLDTLNSLVYQMNNYPVFDSAQTTYKPAYQAIVGSFTGDWINAAERYKKWGSKQQWCVQSRLKNNLSPAWLNKTALWVWNRGQSSNVLLPAASLKQKLDLPVNVFWHWWHGCSYDDGFPEYFPPREGKKSFMKALAAAQQDGLKAIVYMNVLQWGTSTDSWKKENASAAAVKDINGNMNSHVYNVFTAKSLTSMCIGTRFWKDKYASLCERALNSYHLNGIYMDQACLSRTCYDSHHGHPLGGGNYWVENFETLTGQIRAETTQSDQPVLAGEGCGEVWLPYLDVFLALQVSMERYAGINGREPIPFFQAVYHAYGITYGNYSSLLIPPYDTLWPKAFAPKNPTELLDKKYNRQFLMEQARSFVWGMQPTIANYREFLNRDRKEEIDYLINLAKVRYQGLKYLLRGEFLRSPDNEFPQEELNISRLSIYAGREGQSVTHFQKSFPLVYEGTWKSDDNQIGIALASISDKAFPVNLSFDSSDYNLPASGTIYLIDTGGKRILTSYTDGKIEINFRLPPKGLCIVEIIAG